MLDMDTRRRAAPLCPAVESAKRSSPRPGIKETNLVFRSRTPSNHQSSGVTAYSLSTNSSYTGCGPAKAAASPFTLFDKIAGDSRSETSRSSTPVTDMSSLCLSSGSSFATSVQPDAECGYPRDEEQDSCAGGSERDYDATPDETRMLDEADMAAARRALNSHVLRQSQLRYSMSAHSPASGVSNFKSTDLGFPGDDDDDNIGIDDDDDDWSGTDSLDAAVIAAVDGDLSLAAFLIPLLHRDLRNAVRNKVESWQNSSTTIRAPSSAAGTTLTRDGVVSGVVSGATSGNSVVGSGSCEAQDHESNRSRKRRRRRSGSEDREDGDDEQEGNGGSAIPRPEMLDELPMPLLACPFHKLNPARYGIQHNVTAGSRKDGYRACAGPGFKSIQRLKEHLKRKHTPVQCERCYLVFSGSDKARCINELTEHLRLEVPCQRGESVLKEGISEAQWAALDKQNRKKNQEKHKVEKWFEIWRVLFPEVPEPDTPWYDEASPNRYPSPSRENEAFADLFLHILNHKVQQGDISFPGCNTDDVQQRLRNLVQQTFRTYVNLHGPLSRTTDTSSSQTGTNNLQSSLLGGSSTHQSRPSNSLSLPATATSHTTGTVVTPMHPQVAGQYALNMSAVTGVSTAGMPYAVPMTQRPNSFPQYHPSIGMASMPGQMPGTLGTAMPANYSQEDMTMYYPAPIVHWQSANIPYGTGLPAHYSDYYGQTGGFGPGTGGEFDNGQ